ncbi:MAG: BlaI/MecI/CopY family transcriptional regulator [Gammaproteobacteria bacterium]
MNDTSEFKLSGLQLDLMQAIWDAGEATVAQVHEAVAARGLAYTTVATLLKRLESKGALESTRNGREIVYRASVSARSVRKSMVADLVSNLFNGDPRELVAHLVRESEIRPGDIDRARDLLARANKDKTDE